jgi:hypothetical protein
MQEARELANDPCTDYHAAPLEVRRRPKNQAENNRAVNGRMTYS